MPSKAPRHFTNLFLRLFAVAAVLLCALTTVRAATEPSEAAGGVTVSSTYTLHSYDVIDVQVYGEDDLHTRTRLGADGTALFPLIGTVKLSGQTVSDANALLQQKYGAGFVKDPHVLLTVVEYRKQTFSIMGQINRPGIYEIPEGTSMNIVDAVLLAGGFTHTASQNSVKVKRNVKGKAVVLVVKAGAMADHPDVKPFEIQPGDIIKVPESWF